ncbi:AhpC/Tsa family protein [Rhodopirellula maiorica SM1]|uniref:thioredoxin-dependent peroxiredoxin n=1 Tax=Rhodopirellula maiorica SM1 TaxID=1265738 RepID=M5RQM5_9BACT|nr:peroxiredoxin-like family protein [Rhodopirellula maiorica]EMI21516.1 AhpC/Tsa family protein [Rhodopirellula maiorica SM1]
MLKLSISSLLALALLTTPGFADDPQSKTLNQELADIAATTATRFSPEKAAIFRNGVAEVKASGIEKSAKQVGDAAVDGKLTGWDGKSIQLSELWSEGPVVLMWYRGGWCPYCNAQLRATQKQLSAIEGAGARLVVLTPELPEKAKATAEANNLNMVALHDKDNQLAHKYGIVFSLPQSIAPIFQDKLASYNGSKAAELPLSATYVIDTDGKITYAYLNADYTKRPEPADVIAAVESL